MMTDGGELVPLTRPSIGDAERARVRDVLDSRELKGGGTYDRRCSDLLESAFDARRVLMTTSCTHALEMAALLLEIDEGDEVVVPAYTFPSTATAFALRGADVAFADVEPDTLAMDPDSLREVISRETAAVVPVHYAGIPGRLDEISEIATAHDAALVEDAAQAISGFYRGDALGTIGELGCYSFHGTKSHVAGEGGALVINEDRFVERAEIIRQKGTNYAKFRRGEVEEYTWVDVGSSYVPSELQTALAYAQLERRDELRSARRAVFEAYLDGLDPLERCGVLDLPTVPSAAEPSYGSFYVLAGDRRERDDLVTHLRDRNVGAASHYRPLHTSEMGRRYGYEAGDLPTSERVAKSLVRLPMHPEVSPSDRRTVIDAVRSFFEQREAAPESTESR